MYDIRNKHTYSTVETRCLHFAHLSDQSEPGSLLGRVWEGSRPSKVESLA